MKERAYIYRREDNDELVEVSWDVMITQDAGFITLPDGVAARRCLYLELDRDGRPERNTNAGETERTIVSDALGFPQKQLADFEADRRAHGHTDVEFVRDKDIPEFIQVKASSRAAMDRYTAHRGMVNKGNGGGIQLTQHDLDQAAILVGRLK